MNIPSYTNKTFFVESNDARIRKENLKTPDTYSAGESRPAGTSVGAPKRLPKHTEVRVLRTAVDDDKNVLAYVEPVGGPPGAPSGWTRVTNFEGQLLNELLGYGPDGWHEPPGGVGHTVVDPRALVRGGAPTFSPTGGTIPAGTFVRVVDRGRAGDAEYVRVERVTFDGGPAGEGEDLGWTAATNLLPGCGPGYGSDDWKAEKGPYGCWRGGKHLGPRVLVRMVGTGGELESVTLDTLPHYLRLVDEAAKEGVRIGLTSGFRTYPEQARLYKLYQQKKGNKAAEPGRSNHQHGQAYDLNTHSFTGPTYAWLAKHGPRLGFVRTVGGEHWHWEYRPDDAAALAQQKQHKMPGVKD